MPWPPKIERFREIVSWESNGLPHDLVLALIKQESGGTIGRQANSTCRPGKIPSLAGGFITFNRALGLMQIIPGTIASYNKRNPNSIVYFEQMSGKTFDDARIQIRVGCEILNKEISTLHRFYPIAFPGTGATNSDTNQIICALLAYRMGAGALRKRLNKLLERGLALTYSNIKSEFPLWGYNQETEHWINRPIHYADTIWTAALNHGMTPGAPVDNIPGPQLPETQLAGSGGGLGVLAAIVIGLLVLGSRKR